MSAKIKYADQAIGSLKAVPDFLRALEEFAFKKDTVKVTIALSRESAEFFMQKVEKHHAQCRNMTRWLLDTHTLVDKRPRVKCASRQKGGPLSIDLRHFHRFFISNETVLTP